MLNIAINIETGLAKPSQTAVIKAGGGVPVTVTFSANPGANPVIELALTPQSSSPAVKAYLDVFEAQNETVYTGVLDATDTRLITLLTGKSAQTLDCEIVVTTLANGRLPFPNFPITVQPPVITGPVSSEGGPVYLTEALGDQRYPSLADPATARTDLGLADLLFREPVAVPTGDNPFAAAGSKGQYAFDDTNFRFWFHNGTQWFYFTPIGALS